MLLEERGQEEMFTSEGEIECGAQESYPVLGLQRRPVLVYYGDIRQDSKQGSKDGHFDR